MAMSLVRNCFVFYTSFVARLLPTWLNCSKKGSQRMVFFLETIFLNSTPTGARYTLNLLLVKEKRHSGHSKVHSNISIFIQCFCLTEA